MTSTTHNPLLIIRTERGLTVAGTRITLYDVMDYWLAQYPPQFIRSLFDFTEDQMNAALAYIEANRSEVEREYQLVLQQAEENRHYWEDRHRELIDQAAHRLPQPGRELLWEKLRAQKAQHEQDV